MSIFSVISGIWTRKEETNLLDRGSLCFYYSILHWGFHCRLSNSLLCGLHYCYFSLGCWCLFCLGLKRGGLVTYGEEGSYIRREEGGYIRREEGGCHIRIITHDINRERERKMWGSMELGIELQSLGVWGKAEDNESHCKGKL